MNSQPIPTWRQETLKKSVTIKRYAVLSGTTILVYNKRDGVKHRQQTVQDLHFTDTDVISQDENDVYRVRLDKGDWEWFDVDTGDICDVTITSRKQLNPITSNDLERLSHEVDRVLKAEMSKNSQSKYSHSSYFPSSGSAINTNPSLPMKPRTSNMHDVIKKTYDEMMKSYVK